MHRYCRIEKLWRAQFKRSRWAMSAEMAEGTARLIRSYRAIHDEIQKSDSPDSVKRVKIDCILYRISGVMDLLSQTENARFIKEGPAARLLMRGKK